MPWQLIYTSAPRGLAAGQSGFCTVARSADLRDALVTRLEQLSSYHHLATPGTTGGGANPRVAAYRILDVRGAKYHVLSRIQDAGLDFTNRTNHLAHHLVFQPFELLTLPSPPVILEHWSGWRNRWQEEPRWLADDDLGNLSGLPRLAPPASAWQRTTGDGARAAALLQSPFADGCYLLSPRGEETALLRFFAESLQLLNPQGQAVANLWQYTFTTFLQGEDNPADFRWRGCWEGSPAHQMATRTGAPATTLAALPVPEGRLAHLARYGRLPPATATELGPVASPPNLRRPGSAPPPLGSAGPSSSPGSRPARALAEESDSVSDSKLLLAAGAVLLLCILAFAGWIWPGWFQREQEPPTTPVAETQPRPEPKPPPDKTESLSTSEGEMGIADTATNVAPPAKVPPTGQLKTQLDSLLPDLPTLIAVAPFTGPAELPSFKPFEKLLEGLASSAEPVAPQTVECLVESRGLAMSLAKPGSVGRLSTDLFGKSITVSNEANTGAQFDFSRWYADHRSAILLHARVPAGQNCVSLVFRPGGDNARGFQSFRLVALDPARRPEPVSLERYFWAQGGTNLLDWLLPPLQARISQWQWPPGSRLQMRPQALQPRTAQSFDLYEALPAFAQPPPGQDMDLHLVRTNLAARLKSVEEEMAALERKLRSSLTNLAENPALAYGWPYGRLLPESAEAALHSFPAYLGARKAQPSTFTLVEYIRRVLDAGGKRFGDATEAMRLLDNPATQLQGLREAQRVVRAFAGSARRNLPVPPGDHLFALGQELQHHGRLAAELEARVAEVERVKLGLRLTRPAATVLHYGSLFLLHPAGKVELLRFDQPRPRVAP